MKKVDELGISDSVRGGREMSRGKTIHVNIKLTDDPAVLLCRVRLGNGRRRATIRKEGGFTTEDIFRLVEKPEYLADLLDEAKARGEVWVKPGLGKPWRKETIIALENAIIRCAKNGLRSEAAGEGVAK